MMHHRYLTILTVSTITLMLVGVAIANEPIAESFRMIRGNMTERVQARYKIPPRYYSHKTFIALSYEPLQIITVDEIFQTITVTSTVTLVWPDPNIGWDPNDYNGLEQIEMSSSLFWTPTILIPKTTVTTVITLHMPEYVYVKYTGQISAFVPAFTTTLCNLDMTHFPFDTHNCTIVFLEAEFYNLTSLVLPSTNISEHFGTNAAWILLDYGCNPTTTHKVYPPFGYIICYVQMQRRSTFFIVNLIGPMALTSLMTLIVFWIPAEEGEKITFLVSMFMSTSVFLNYIIDLIPRSMESVPKLNLLLFAIILQVILATVATAVVLRRFKQERQNEQERDNERQYQPQIQRHHHQQQHQQKQQQKRYTWLWDYCTQNKPQAEEQAQQGDIRRDRGRQQNLIQRKNAVYPDVTNVGPPNNYDDRNLNYQTLYVAASGDKTTNEKNELKAPEIFTVDNDVPKPPEYTPPQNGGKRKQGKCSRRFTHDELDRIFFVMMSLLTIATYLFAFLS